MATGLQPYDVSEAFDDYMQRVAPTVAKDGVQYRETRRAWYAATRRMLSYLKDDISAAPEAQGMAELERLECALAEFWERALQNKD